jgi:hypothetical protein
LSQLNNYELIIGLTVLWSPSLNRGRSARWAHWRHFLRDWNLLRAEYFERHPHRRAPDRWPFAERVAVFVQRHGFDALDHADLDTLKRGNDHDDNPSDPAA